MHSLLPTAPPTMNMQYRSTGRSANWWLRQTSWGWNLPIGAPLWQREQARRSRLASWVILGLVVGVVLLSPLAIEDTRSQLTLAVWVLGLVGAVALNRQGWVTAAGSVLVALFSGGILFANLASPIGLTMGELPNFDAYVVSVVLAATLLPRAMTFLVAGVNTLLIVGNYLLQPHNANITQDAALYSSVTVQTVSLLGAPYRVAVGAGGGGVSVGAWSRGGDPARRPRGRDRGVATTGTDPHVRPPGRRALPSAGVERVGGWRCASPHPRPCPIPSWSRCVRTSTSSSIALDLTARRPLPSTGCKRRRGA